MKSRLSNQEPEKNENLRVVIRVRPPMAREIKDGKFISTVSNKNKTRCKWHLIINNSAFSIIMP